MWFSSIIELCNYVNIIWQVYSVLWLPSLNVSFLPFPPITCLVKRWRGPVWPWNIALALALFVIIQNMFFKYWLWIDTTYFCTMGIYWPNLYPHTIYSINSMKRFIFELIKLKTEIKQCNYLVKTWNFYFWTFSTKGVEQGMVKSCVPHISIW